VSFWRELSNATVRLSMPALALKIVNFLFQGLCYESFFLVSRYTGWPAFIGGIGICIAVIVLFVYACVGVALSRGAGRFLPYVALYASWPAWARSAFGADGRWDALEPFAARFSVLFETQSGASSALWLTVPLPFVKAMLMALITAVDSPPERCDAVYGLLIACCWVPPLLQLAVRRPYRFNVNLVADVVLSTVTGFMLLAQLHPHWGADTGLYLTVVYAGLGFALASVGLGLYEAIQGPKVEPVIDGNEAAAGPKEPVVDKAKMAPAPSASAATPAAQPVPAPRFFAPPIGTFREAPSYAIIPTDPVQAAAQRAAEDRAAAAEILCDIRRRVGVDDTCTEEEADEMAQAMAELQFMTS
jgi:hypothetical protein